MEKIFILFYIFLQAVLECVLSFMAIYPYLTLPSRKKKGIYRHIWACYLGKIYQKHIYVQMLFYQILKTIKKGNEMAVTSTFEEILLEVQPPNYTKIALSLKAELQIWFSIEESMNGETK